MNDERLFTHNIFSAVFIKLRKFLITDCLHTENSEDKDVRKRTVWGNVNHRNLNGCPQTDDGGEQQLSKIGQQLKANY